MLLLAPTHQVAGCVVAIALPEESWVVMYVFRAGRSEGLEVEDWLELIMDGMVLNYFLYLNLFLGPKSKSR